MKNIIRSVLLLIIVAMATCLTACGLFVEDKQNALVELTSTSGYAAVASSYNGLGKTWSGLYGAQRKVCKVSLKNEKDVLTVHFQCDACGHDEVCELTAPAAKTFKCDCEEDGDEKNNAKEYFCVLVSIGEASETPE